MARSTSADLAHSAADLVRRVIVLHKPGWDEVKRWARHIDFSGKGWTATPLLGQLIVAAGHRAIARAWFATALGKDANVSEFSRHATAAFDAGCGWALASLVQTYFASEAPVFSPVAQPALIIWGAQDTSHRRTDPKSVLPYFKDAEVVTFERAGHSPELEQPLLFAEHLIRLTDAS